MNETITLYIWAEHTPRAGYTARISAEDYADPDECQDDYQEISGTREELIDLRDSYRRAGGAFARNAADAIDEVLS